MYLSRTSLFQIAILVGMAVGYFPIAWYIPAGVQRAGNEIINNGAYIDTSYTTLRGVISGVDTKSRVLTMVAVSPYSPLERALFSASFDDTTLFRSISPIPESPNLFIPTSDFQEMDASVLVAGAPVTVRVSRGPGPLHAFWIAVRAPID